MLVVAMLGLFAILDVMRPMLRMLVVRDVMHVVAFSFADFDGKCMCWRVEIRDREHHHVETTLFFVFFSSLFPQKFKRVFSLNVHVVKVISYAFARVALH